ncbi:MAG: 4-(cytidine 5'-diphospho)-2-C-methyl-D-erythritol kinase [Clostridia bacterium]|nr:4-(cytidine 5'-diphospho)-2-C-methyl-D-erythritol kinase [Clostridia bacterium]
MDELSLNAYAKINWRLEITGVRTDGYHELDMLMQTISLHDVLCVKKSNENKLTVNNVPVEDADSNLVIKAAHALSDYTGENISASFSLIKNIPSMAGLGGGSSDCAAALKALNEMYNLRLSTDELMPIALRLGADVPFFLHSGLCRVRGIGEQVDRISPAPMANLVIYHVQGGLSTPKVYKKFDEMKLPTRKSGCEAFVKGLISGKIDSLEPVNDLEPPAIALLPDIAYYKNLLSSHGALYTLMSGSGSAVYGVFETEAMAVKASSLMPHSVHSITLS